MVFNEIVHRDKVIINCHHYSEFLYPITNRYQFRCNKLSHIREEKTTLESFLLCGKYRFIYWNLLLTYKLPSKDQASEHYGQPLPTSSYRFHHPTALHQVAQTTFHLTKQVKERFLKVRRCLWKSIQSYPPETYLTIRYRNSEVVQSKVEKKLTLLRLLGVLLSSFPLFCSLFLILCLISEKINIIVIISISRCLHTVNGKFKTRTSRKRNRNEKQI